MKLLGRLAWGIVLVAASSKFAPSAWSDAVYKCVDAQGNVTFNHRPCGENAQEIRLESPLISQPANLESDKQLGATTKQYEEITQRLRIQRIEDQLRRREAELDSSNLALDTKLAELEKQHAAQPQNYLLRRSIRAAQAAARLEYDAKIGKARRDVSRLRAELSRAQSQQGGPSPGPNVVDEDAAKRRADTIEQHELPGRQLRLRGLEDQLRRRERELDSLTFARDRKLAELERQRARAVTGPPGEYMLDDRIRALQEAARLEYDAKISKAQRDVNRLRSELSRGQ